MYSYELYVALTGNCADVRLPTPPPAPCSALQGLTVKQGLVMLPTSPSFSPVISGKVVNLTGASVSNNRLRWYMLLLFYFGKVKEKCKWSCDSWWNEKSQQISECGCLFMTGELCVVGLRTCRACIEAGRLTLRLIMICFRELFKAFRVLWPAQDTDGKI